MTHSYLFFFFYSNPSFPNILFNIQLYSAYYVLSTFYK